MIRILRITIGVVCIVIGLLALVTPLTPGAWLALVGVELLGLSYLLPKRIREPWHKMRDEWKEKIRAWWKRRKGERDA